jgi:phage recombination protein Bet
MATEANIVTLNPQLPEPVARRGINEAAWRTLMNTLYPGADPHSVLMVWDYCIARKLDPLKKPCHIVPMQVKDARTGEYQWRDVVLPGIYEYRTTATRTGFYLGHSRPEYGEMVDFLGVTAPEWCSITIYRWNEAAKLKTEYPVTVYFRECAGTRQEKINGKKTGAFLLNDRWQKAPIQMLTKCTEAAGLREAFPDELGGTHTAEESDGKVVDSDTSFLTNPRGDQSDKVNVDPEEVRTLADKLYALMDSDVPEETMALSIFDFETTVIPALGEHREALVIAAMDLLPPKWRRSWKGLSAMGREIANRPLGE